MKTYFKKGSIYLAIGFVTLFLLRLIYGYFVPNENFLTVANERSDAGLMSALQLSRNNYATDKLTKFDGGSVQPRSVDQKYEKVGSLLSQTAAFDDDEKKSRELVKKYNAQIQLEQSSGLPGNKRLSLAIGVQPAGFDNFIAEIKTIGRLMSIEINKTDKTNEYKELNAQRVSLEKTRDALLALKSKGGTIEDQMNLESKILEIETQLQETGVKLGEFDAENEFCTVKFGLSEQRSANVKIPFLYRVRVALEWTIRYYLLFLFAVLTGTLVILVTILVLDKVRAYRSTEAEE
jgi:Domain of unknown function (DUF4349)